MRSFAVVLAGLATLASAQSTARLLLPFADDSGFVGSIIGSDATATTYSVTCRSSSTSSAVAVTATTTRSRSGSDNSFGDCGIPGGATVTQGPATVHYVYSLQSIITYSIDCSLQGTTAAHCTNTIKQVEQDSSTTSVFSSAQTSSVSDAELASAFVPVTITAGAAAQATSSSKTGAAMPMATGAAKYVVGGMAMAVAAAL